jgi:hypothetical protein
MGKDLIPNFPSHELAAKQVASAPKPKRFPITLHVRAAIHHAVADKEHYDELCHHFAGGRISGSTQADLYFFAQTLVDWERAAGRHSLDEAIHSGDIRLVDIVKRLAPELKKVNIAVERGVITGTLLPQS